MWKPEPIRRPHPFRQPGRAGRVALAALALAAGTLAPRGGPPTVEAQAATGSIAGVVRDRDTGEVLAGATVVITDAAGTIAPEITDEHGRYRVDGLRPGRYRVTVFYGDVQVERGEVIVTAGRVTKVAVSVKAVSSEVITITASAPTIDPTTTTTGVTLTADYTKNPPVGRTFGAALGAAAGTQGDSLGVSFSGATSAQSTYVAQGINTPSGAPGADVAHHTEAYARLRDNPFHHVALAPRSTFSIDVDTASYANLRRFVREATPIPADAIRTEELINYFRYRDPEPTGPTPFAVTTELAASPWHPGFQLLRVALRTRPIVKDQVLPRNLVFLLDVSGSMESPEKLPLLVQSMGLLVDNLRPQDQVAIVVYAGAEGVALPTTSGADKAAIRAALANLAAGGSTNGGAGITRAYALARASFLTGGVNRVILCTDGDFNVGTTSEGELTRLIEDERKHGVYLSVLGFGMGNLKDSTLEALARDGNGNYAYIDSLAEARKVLIAEGGATLVTVADDVKLQVEFNPAQVAGYRLIGYEDRLLADRDFADDAKDAGELGAGHSVTALYELVPVGATVPGPAVEPLTYQTPAAATGSRELLTINVRYKRPGAKTSTLSRHAVAGAPRALSDTSDDFRWSAAMAGLGMLLRGAPDRGAVTWAEVAALAKGAVGPDPEGYRKDALAVIAGAEALAPKP
ncbi:MAG: von Willebrand factor type A domain-containing protein [Kofleriaceae bacterium]|nr:von Willebrand factor type A domain-containing protein [Kofleriaceae bacterium]MBP9168047.1 von Willebrand factor type A domain-containing protein [Kofleriaceae bacterium]MBP9856881.1 von Willebrand factor type A domain-containing protein [Kofleriaceae bacterium]